MKLTFYFPYREVSGVPVLFSNIINKIKDENFINKIYIIDYIDGALNLLTENSEKIKRLYFEDGITISPPKDAILIMQSINPYSIRPELNIQSNTKLFFWNLHPNNLVPNIFPTNFFIKIQNKHFNYYKILVKIFASNRLKKNQIFLDYCVKYDAIRFMDSSNLNFTNKHLFRNINKVKYLPVPIRISNCQFNKYKFLKEDKINMCWVGRLCDFKIHILVYTIKEIEKYTIKNKKHITFYVIGDGNFNSYLRDLNITSKYLKIVQKGILNPKKLEKFLQNKIDVAAAMGTSALECSKLKIPTLLLDYSYNKINKDYFFKWIFERQNFDLGHNIENDDYVTNNNSLEIKLNNLVNNYNQISTRTFNYTLNNHSIENVSKDFIIAVKSTSLTYGHFNKKVFRKNFLRKTYENIKYK